MRRKIFADILGLRRFDTSFEIHLEELTLILGVLFKSIQESCTDDWVCWNSTRIISEAFRLILQLKPVTSQFLSLTYFNGATL